MCSKRHTDIINERRNTKAPSCSKAALLRYKEIYIFFKEKIPQNMNQLNNTPNNIIY